MFSELGVILLYNFKVESESRVLVDVGAHHGSFSAPFAKNGWKIIAFEPEHKNREAFQRNLSRYQDVMCIPKAVSDVDGDKVPFYVSSEHFGIHALKPFHLTHKKAYDVETVCLNTALDEAGVRKVTLLKIDTEGADFLALKGFDVAKYCPELIILEFMDERSKPNYGYTHHDVVQHMQKYNYVAFLSEWAPIQEYGREGVKSAPHIWLQCVEYPLDHEPAWGNLLFVPQQDKQKFVQCLNNYLRSNTRLRRFISKLLNQSL